LEDGFNIAAQLTGCQVPFGCRQAVARVACGSLPT
jgi:hypothetical protein